ncbi:MAG TPA: 50S ribosomal protein L15 [Myxococcota bacterium]|nr:50S ribosomal protein L15 [Myxococcota bacterium]
MLDRLAPRPGARQKRKRVARGSGSGLQKTAGRGGKGQGKNSRGNETPNYFEGGQMPLVRRLPKRGFTNVHRRDYEIVNLGDLESFGANAEVDLAALTAKGLVRRSATRVKLLGEGDAPQGVKIRVHKASESAVAKVRGAGGSVEIVS